MTTWTHATRQMKMTWTRGHKNHHSPKPEALLAVPCAVTWVWWLAAALSMASDWPVLRHLVNRAGKSRGTFKIVFTILLQTEVNCPLPPIITSKWRRPSQHMSSVGRKQRRWWQRRPVMRPVLWWLVNLSRCVSAQQGMLSTKTFTLWTGTRWLSS